MRPPYDGNGTPGLLFVAIREYAERCRELEGSGVEGRDELILAECAAALTDDVAREPINLTSWAMRFGVPRPVLEALVLRAWSRQRKASPPVARAESTSPRLAEEPASAPWTPAPCARRPEELRAFQTS